MKTFFLFEKKGREGFELKVSAGNLSDHQKRLIVSSIGEETCFQVNGYWLESEEMATAYGLAALIKAAGYIHSNEEVTEMVDVLQNMLQEKWDNRPTRPK